MLIQAILILNSTAEFNTKNLLHITVKTAQIFLQMWNYQIKRLWLSSNDAYKTTTRGPNRCASRNKINDNQAKRLFKNLTANVCFVFGFHFFSVNTTWF